MGLYNGQKLIKENVGVDNSGFNSFLVGRTGEGIVDRKSEGWKADVQGLKEQEGKDGEEQLLVGEEVLLPSNNDGSISGEAVDSETFHNNIKILTRLSKDEYIKVVTQNGRVVGCLICGESDLEETMENVILSKINVENLGFDILDGDIDVEDFFD